MSLTESEKSNACQIENHTFYDSKDYVLIHLRQQPRSVHSKQCHNGTFRESAIALPQLAHSVHKVGEMLTGH